MTVRTSQSQESFSIDNGSIIAMEAATLSLPEGQSYVSPVGHLALGSVGEGAITYYTNPPVIGYAFPGALATTDRIPSNSFGLHYGSASLGLNGSLAWGGYDQSRVIGDIGAFSIEDDDGQENIIVQILDIHIGVQVGESPFATSDNGSDSPAADSYTGLLKVNASYGFHGRQPTNINPVLNYLYMDPETCAAIAQHLPVTLQHYTNLYIWNTSEPSYARIVTSSAYLAFVFENGSQGNLTVKIPFQLLNLTLDEPIASPPVQYFPWQPFHANDGSNHYFFGKAFLQAAFLGMNWEQKKFFLAQAPGPGAQPPNVQDIAKDDVVIQSDPIDGFESSWNKTWTPLLEASSSAGLGNSSSSGPAQAPASQASSKGGLSGGAKAGIAVGAILGGVLIGAVVLFLLCDCRWNRDKNASGLTHRTKKAGQQGLMKPLEKDGRQVLAVGELDSKNMPHELGNERQLYELRAK